MRGEGCAATCRGNEMEAGREGTELDQAARDRYEAIRFGSNTTPEAALVPRSSPTPTSQSQAV